MFKDKKCSCGGKIIKDNEAPWFVPDMSYSCSNKKCKKRFCIFCGEEINKKIEVFSQYFNNYSAEDKTEHMTANPCSGCGVLYRQWGQLLVVDYIFVFGFPPIRPYLYCDERRTIFILEKNILIAKDINSNKKEKELYIPYSVNNKG